MTSTSRILAVISSGLIFSFAARGSQSETLQWNASVDRATAGYILHCGTNSHSYTSTVNVGTNTLVTLSGLAGGRTYFVAVGGYNNAGMEGALSSEVSFVAPTNATTTNSPTTNAPPTNSSPTGKLHGKRSLTVAPASGTAGAKIYVYATNLSDVTSVDFNGVPAPIIIVSNSCLETIVPPGAITGPLNFTTSSETFNGQFIATGQTLLPNGSFAKPLSQLTAPIALGDGSRMVNFQVASGHSYRVLASTNLATWSQVSSFYATGTNASYIDAAAASYPRQFYRLVSP